MASAHHLLVDPGMGPAWKVWNTSYAMYLAVLASMIHGFTVPAGMEVGQRMRGLTKGLFEWLRKAPWGDPGFSSLVFSVVLFGFVGGITGVTFGTEQINIIAHNTLRVPGHFHAAVVAGTTTAFMGVTYYVIPLIFRKKIAFWPLARVQPYLFAAGMLIFTVSMTFAGTFGVPRRHWDITFSQAPFDLQFSPAVDLLLAVMAIGGLLAAAGGAIYIVVTVWSVFLGKPLEAGSHPQGVANPPGPIPALQGGDERTFKAPGTMVMVFLFLAVFVLYYFVNWKLLSAVWQVG
jgi:cytochrome c oxidase subunit 1